jgi:hypothetical protein
MVTLSHPRKLALFAALNLADLALTWHLVGRGGGAAYESNPVAAWWLVSFGWAGLAGFKLAAVGVVAALALVVSRSRPRVGGRLLAFGCSALLGVVLYSGFLVHGLAAEASAPAAAEPARTAETESEKLDSQLQEVSRRLYGKEHVAAEVARGRLTLLEAAARFRDLNAELPGFQREQFRSVYPGRSDDERHCWQVIRFVRTELQDVPNAVPRVVGRLEAELQARVDRGDLRLPEPVPAAQAGG